MTIISKNDIISSILICGGGVMFYDMSLETEELKKGNIEICELIGSDGVYDVFRSLKSQEEKDELLSIILQKIGIM